MDMLLAACDTAALALLALRLLGIAGRSAVPAASAFVGLAVLAKGPLGLLLPALVVGGYVVTTREWRWLRELLAPASLLAFLLVAGPWYGAVLRDQGRAFVDVFLLGHNLERFTSTVHHHPGPLVYYVPVLLLGLFPWTGLLVPALASLAPRDRRADLLLLLWLALPFLFFSAAGSKLPGYILPCLPPLALLMGRAADGWRLDSRWTRAAGLLGLMLGALVATGPAFLRRLDASLWTTALPAALWSLAVAFLVSRRLEADAVGALRLLRVGGAGLLLLLATAAPPIVDRLESGRRLFVPAGGREVLAWGAWRTAWMAGYFYNDGRVREATDLAEVLAARPTLALVGPGERRRLEALPDVVVRPLAEGPRQNVLLSLESTPR
jgi:4-amino-4-deoxy-L-arabinose transferase-like glycosyltransferase